MITQLNGLPADVPDLPVDRRVYYEAGKLKHMFISCKSMQEAWRSTSLMASPVSGRKTAQQ